MPFVLDAFYTGTRHAPTKSNYDAPTHTISFVGLASSHDLVETVVFVLMTRSIGKFAVHKKGGCLQRRSSLNLVVFAVLVVSSMNMVRMVTLICHDQNSACLGCDRFVQTCHSIMEVYCQEPPY